MTETSATTIPVPDTKIRQTALVGYKAVIDHAVENGLPAPESIDLGIRSMQLWVTRGVDKWLASIHVDREAIRPAAIAGREIVHVDGRLPLLGIKVQIRYSRAAVPAHLQAVGE